MSTDTPVEWADIEGALRAYLRSDSDIQAVVGNRVFFGAPRDSRNAFPLISITRIGGGEQSSEMPLDMAFIQFDIYGQLADEASGGKMQVSRGAQALRKSLSKLRGRTEIAPGVLVSDPRVTTVVYSPLPGDDRPRCFVMAIVPNIVIATGDTYGPGFHDYYGGGGYD